MSCIPQANIAIEDHTSKKEGEAEMLMPLAAPDNRVHAADSVTCRATKVLYLQLERGSMPA